jgi:rod shape-determining protein MreC
VQQQRRARILFAALLFTALVLVTIDFRGGEDGPADRLRNGVTVIMRPVQDGVATLMRPFGDLGGGVRDVVSTRAENQRLREEVAALEARRSSSVDLERENRQLRELLAMRDRTELETVTARTVALAPSSFEWTITIDVGSVDGIDRDMPVIDGDGLVGRVIQVTPNASRVLLSIDPNFSAASRTARTGEIGPIDGRGGDPMVMRPLDPDADIQVGDEIVTSSYQGGVFPAGIPIGTVSEVVETGSRLTREVQVSPFVDFTRLDHVLVVRTSAVGELPPFEGTEGLEFRRPDVAVTPDADDSPDGDDEGDGDDGDGDDDDDDDDDDDQGTVDESGA